MNKNKLVGFALLVSVASSLYGAEQSKEGQTSQENQASQSLEKVSDLFEDAVASTLYFAKQSEDKVSSESSASQSPAVPPRPAVCFGLAPDYKLQNKLLTLPVNALSDEHKQLIKEMINIGKSPNNIVTGNDGKDKNFVSPLFASVLHEDIGFTTYLLEHDAQPDAQVLELVQSRPTMAALLLAHKSVKNKSTHQSQPIAEAKE